jgi:hypothetical protein
MVLVVEMGEQSSGDTLRDEELKRMMKFKNEPQYPDDEW